MFSQIAQINQMNAQIIEDNLAELSAQYDMIWGWGVAIWNEGVTLFDQNPDSPALIVLADKLAALEDDLADVVSQLEIWQTMWFDIWALAQEVA